MTTSSNTCTKDMPRAVVTGPDGAARSCDCGRTFRVHTTIGPVLMTHGRRAINGEWREGDVSAAPTAAGIEVRKAEAKWNGVDQMLGVPIRMDPLLPENAFMIDRLMFMHRDGKWFRLDLDAMPEFGRF